VETIGLLVEAIGLLVEAIAALVETIVALVEAIGEVVEAIVALVEAIGVLVEAISRGSGREGAMGDALQGVRDEDGAEAETEAGTCAWGCAARRYGAHRPRAGGDGTPGRRRTRCRMGTDRPADKNVRARDVKS